MEKQITGLKKRQQIKKANNAMLLWVIAASAAVTVCAVLAYFLIGQMIFNQRIISAKTKTNSTLKQNKETFETIKSEVTKLLSNQNLNTLKVSPDDTALQVVVDALPTNDDRAALGTSLQDIVLSRSGVMIESMSVVEGNVASSVEDVVDTSVPQEIPFSLVLIGSYGQITQAIADMERSIRPIKIDTMKLEGSGTRLRASITARTFYLPAKSVELKTETIEP